MWRSKAFAVCDAISHYNTSVEQRARADKLMRLIQDEAPRQGISLEPIR